MGAVIGFAHKILPASAVGVYVGKIVPEGVSMTNASVLASAAPQAEMLMTSPTVTMSTKISRIDAEPGAVALVSVKGWFSPT